MANARGFTLVEMLLSVGIISILAGLSLPVYLSFQTRNELDVAAQDLASALRRAQTYTRGVRGDSPWGVRVQSGSITLFKGSTYASRDTTYDETNALSPTTTTGGLGEVVFAKLSGAPASTGSITLTNSNNEVRTISINAKGMVDY